MNVKKISSCINQLWKQMNIYNGYYEYRTLHSIIYSTMTKWKEFDPNVEMLIDDNNGTLTPGVPGPDYNPSVDVPYNLGKFDATLTLLPLTSAYEINMRTQFSDMIAKIVDMFETTEQENPDLNPITDRTDETLGVQESETQDEAPAQEGVQESETQDEASAQEGVQESETQNEPPAQEGVQESETQDEAQDKAPVQEEQVVLPKRKRRK